MIYVLRLMCVCFPLQIHRIVVTVSLLAKELGCYKMSLDCKDKLIPFYKSIGYTLEPGNANTMNIRYEATTRSIGRNAAAAGNQPEDTEPS